MVRFLNFEDGVFSGGLAPVHWSMQTAALPYESTTHARRGFEVQDEDEAKSTSIERANPNLNAMTEALACYPIISTVANHLDLNDLDSLSRTCRQVRSNLLQFRTQLIARCLKCVNESVQPSAETFLYRARAADWYFMEPDGGRVGQGRGKVGSCARDLVADCRRCGSVVCRNCTIKPPAPILHRSRHRRLCPTCVRAPLSALNVDTRAATTTTCTCTSLTGVHLCQPCGRGIRTADNTYDSIWRWRTRYSSTGGAWGGLGTGIGEGNRSFECGRGSQCLAARCVEEETDCDAEDARDSLSQNGSVSDTSMNSSASASTDNDFQSGSYSSTNGSIMSFSSSPRASNSPGYLRHEIEGIGGVVKKKMVRMVKVGACVTEWEDEREAGKYLVREAEGRTRSWCGWCCRVVPSKMDLEVFGLEKV